MLPGVPGEMWKEIIMITIKLNRSEQAAILKTLNASDKKTSLLYDKISSATNEPEADKDTDAELMTGLLKISNEADALAKMAARRFSK